MLGLDISSTAVKLVELSVTGACSDADCSDADFDTNTSAGYRVEHHDVEPLPDNAVVEKNINNVEDVGEAIARLVARCGSGLNTAAVAVAGSAVITRLLAMPAGLSHAEIEEQLQDEADQHIPYPLEEVALDFEIQPGRDSPAKDQVEVLLVACRRENIEQREAALELGGLKAAVVDIEAHCMQRAFGLVSTRMVDESILPGASGQVPVIAIVDVGATMTTLNVLTGGVPYTREQLFGGVQLTEAIQARYGLTAEEALTAQIQGSLPGDYEAELLPVFREAVVQQVARSLQLFASSTGYSGVDQILLAGGIATTTGLVEMMSDRLGKPCRLANPFVDMDCSPDINRADMMRGAPAMMIACGLALRSFAG